MLRRLLSAGLIVVLTAATGAAEVKLVPKFPEDTKSKLRTEVHVEQTMSIAGMEIETDTQVFLVTVVDVGTAGPEGGVRVANGFDSMQVEISLPGGQSLSFDSSNRDQSSDNPQFNSILEIFRAMTDQKWTYVVGKDGRVAEVESDTQRLGSLDPAVAEPTKRRFEPEALKAEANQEIDRLPTYAINKGDTWKRMEKVQLDGGQSLNFERQFEYHGTVEQDGRTLDRITAKCLDVTFDNAPIPNAVFEITKADLKIVTSEGEILFDREKSQVVADKATFRVKGPTTYSINGMDLTGAIDLTLTQETKLVP